MSARRIKVETSGDFASGKTIPLVRLKGKWLERMGLKPETHVKVVLVSQGVIRLEAA